MSVCLLGQIAAGTSPAGPFDTITAMRAFGGWVLRPALQRIIVRGSVGPVAR